MNRSLLLDTTAFSTIIRNEERPCVRLRRELNNGATVLFSPVVYFEIRRGLLKRNAQRLLEKLDYLIAPYLWIDMTRGDWETAAILWAETQSRGITIGDDDLLIAAQANRRGATVVTNNIDHFREVAHRWESWS